MNGWGGKISWNIKNMWKQKVYDKNMEDFLIKSGQGRLLSRILSQRSVDIKNVDKFLSSDYSLISHPYNLNGIEKSSKLFCQIAKNKGTIASIGDFDCDGIISSVMVKELCNVFGLEIYSFLPNRITHGYGLNKKVVDDFIKKSKFVPDLLFLLDIGTNSREEVKLFYDYGIKHIIIIDHHLPSKNKETHALNADALISWHLSENKQEMCTAGEVFQFIRGIRWLTKKINPIEYLSLAAIGTIADAISIMGDNRIIVKNGLSSYALNHVVASGLNSIMKQSKIYSDNLIQSDVSFKIAPKLNAPGRIFNPDIVFDLLIERNPDVADKKAKHIATYNEERKKIQKEIELEAIKMVEIQKNKNGVLVTGENWHIGVVGIVASKLVEIFNKPSIVIGKLGEIWKGSGRSVKGVNIKEILDTCPELFESYGGHSQAVGVTLKPEMVNKANKIFDEACAKYYSKQSIPKNTLHYYDAMIDIPLIKKDTAVMLRNSLYPYCHENNSEPVFMVPRATIMDTSIVARDSWRLFTFFIERNGKRCPHPFKFFTKKFGTELEGVVADVFFTFPQNDNFEESRFSQFELSVADIIPKEKS